jgi:16S rRNA (guanine966-N2)-methyltransferase
MRILAGHMRGRAFDQPKTTATRPLSDKLRAAIFDVVGDPSGWNVLDAYAGSGAVGFEALSRGAAHVDSIEAGRSAARTIELNAAKLGLGADFTPHFMKLENWLARLAQVRYDLIIADPPYDQIDPDLLDRLGALLTPDGILCVSHSSKVPIPELSTLQLARHKIYGDSALSFYVTK